MYTKTGELLMRAKNGQVQNRSRNPKIQNQADDKSHIFHQQSKPIKQSNISHVTHVNEYSFISVSNRPQHQLGISKQFVKQLEVQNFRLIEENMKLVEWSRNFLMSMRQNLLHIIQGIEEYKYLDSVNKLYEVINQVAEYESNGFRVPKVNLKQHYMALKIMDNPESKKLIPSELKIIHYIDEMYDPKKVERKALKKKVFEEAKIPNFQDSYLVKADYSEIQPTSSQAELYQMLLLQSMALQPLVKALMNDHT